MKASKILIQPSIASCCLNTVPHHLNSVFLSYKDLNLFVGCSFVGRQLKAVVLFDITSAGHTAVSKWHIEHTSIRMPRVLLLAHFAQAYESALKGKDR